MKQVELIVSKNPNAFEEAVNAFLKEHTVDDIQYQVISESKQCGNLQMINATYTAMIVYQKGNYND